MRRISMADFFPPLCPSDFTQHHCSYLQEFFTLFLGFKRKEFRGKLAIAITANFINKHTEAESMVEEISGF